MTAPAPPAAAPGPGAPAAPPEPAPDPEPADLVGAEIIATVWAKVRKPEGRRVHLPRAVMVERFRVPAVFAVEVEVDGVRAIDVKATKRLLPGWAPTAFRDDHRNLDNVEFSHAIGFDLDGEGTNLDRDAEALSTFAGFIYSSYQHTPERHRGRAIVWTSRPVLPSEYGACWHFVARQLPTVGKEAKDPSRLWFFPTIPPGGEYRLIELPGEPLDVDAVLLAVSSEASRLVVTAPGLQGLSPSSPTSVPVELGELVSSASRYLAEMPPAINGKGGHLSTWRAAIALVRGFELPPKIALDLLWFEFNERCDLKWSHTELAHKVEDAQHAKVPPGWLRAVSARRQPWRASVALARRDFAEALRLLNDEASDEVIREHLRALSGDQVADEYFTRTVREARSVHDASLTPATIVSAYIRWRGKDTNRPPCAAAIVRLVTTDGEILEHKLVAPTVGYTGDARRDREWAAIGGADPARIADRDEGHLHEVVVGRAVNVVVRDGRVMLLFAHEIERILATLADEALSRSVHQWLATAPPDGISVTHARLVEIIAERKKQ